MNLRGINFKENATWKVDDAPSAKFLSTQEIAADDKNTTDLHQLARFSYNQQLNKYVFHYTVYLPATDYSNQDVRAERLIQVLNDPDYLKTDIGKREADILYGQFFEGLKPTRQKAFHENQRGLGLRYNMPLGYDFRTGPMSLETDYVDDIKKITPTEANAICLDGNSDYFKTLYLWKKMAWTYKYADRAWMYRHPDKQMDDMLSFIDMPFEDVVNTTAEMVSKSLYDYARYNNLNCMYRISYYDHVKPSDRKTKSQRQQSKEVTHYYGCTLAAEEDMKRYGEFMVHAGVPGTSSRETDHCINIAEAATKQLTGKNLVAAQLVESIAHYKTYKMAI